MKKKKKESGRKEDKETEEKERQGEKMIKQLSGNDHRRL
jgi:hypothetical protein